MIIFASIFSLGCAKQIQVKDNQTLPFFLFSLEEVFILSPIATETVATHEKDLSMRVMDSLHPNCARILDIYYTWTASILD